MRFAIALLTVICIASVIGTVVRQHEPYNNYVNQFGPFWARMFDMLGLYAVYSAWWFLLILAFLVLSTGLCLIRNTPLMLREMRVYKENVHIRALQAMGQKAEAMVPDAPADAAQRMGQALVQRGWQVRLQQRQGAQDAGWMVAAKAGSLNKLGFIAAHSAIILICVGGLLDGDLMVRAQTWLNGKHSYSGGGLISDVPAQHRLGSNNPSFRGNVFVPEGSVGDTAVLAQKDGVLLQELPFALELKKFHVEYYPTGMPRLFASDVVIHDRETGEQVQQRIEVNHPASYRGVEIYQSSFEDGGSDVTLQATPIHTGQAGFEVKGKVGGVLAVSHGGRQRTLEITNLRTVNVENFDPAANGGADVHKVDLRHTLGNNLGSAANKNDKTLHNIGPSITYKLRDEAGQAREFNNYMLPVPRGLGSTTAGSAGVPEFLFGVRESMAQDFRYLRIPADANGALDEFLRLRRALMDASQRRAAVARYVQQAAPKGSGEMAAQLTESANRVLELFAGDPQQWPAAQADVNSPAARSFGLQAIAAFVDKTVPADKQEMVGEVLLRILNGTLAELLQGARAAAGLPALDMAQDNSRAWLAQAVVALSDAPLYPEALLFTLKDFHHIQASVFQVTRAPGRWLVYAGCLFLIVGILAMLYIRERRLWIWLVAHSPESAHDEAVPQSQVLMAFSTNRRSLDSAHEFELLRSTLLSSPAQPVSASVS